MNNIDISIVLITYNHENYIQQAIDSILFQNIDFSKCELIIGEDFSSDNTRSIINSNNFESFGRYIKIYRKKNIGLIENYSEALSECRGKYIAVLSGDDFWLSENKLNYQINILNKNDDIFLVYTSVSLTHDGRTFLESNQFKQDMLIDFSIIQNLFDFPFGINASSAVFINKNIDKYISIIKNCQIEDFTLFYFVLSSNYKIYFINQNLSSYRRHPSGLWRSFNPDIQLYTKLEALIHINKYLYNRTLSSRIINDLRLSKTRNASNIKKLKAKIIKKIGYFFKKPDLR